MAQEKEFLGEASREQQMDARSFSWHLRDCVYVRVHACVCYHQVACSYLSVKTVLDVQSI